MRLIIEDSPPASLQPSPFIGIILVKLKKNRTHFSQWTFLKADYGCEKKSVIKTREVFPLTISLLNNDYHYDKKKNR